MQLSNNSVVQKSLNNEIGTKSISTLPKLNSEKNRPPLPQSTQDASDGMNMESTNVVNIQMGQKNTDTD